MLRDLAERYFELQSYLALNQDVRSVWTAHPTFDPATHFFEQGMDEGRSPSIYFDTGFVRHRLARIDRVIVDHRTAFRRFAELPRARRFVPNHWFSPWAFRRLYGTRFADFADLSDYELFEFFMDRPPSSALSPCGVFNEERYRLNHRDVAIAIGRGEQLSGFAHFLFDAQIAPRNNLPARAVEPSAATHAEAAWLASGQRGLEPLVWWFDEGFYLSLYADVHDLVRHGIVKSGLEHYLITGFTERRLPCAAMFRHLPGPRDLDPWQYFAGLSPPPMETKISLDEACAILRHVGAEGDSVERERVTSSLWPHIAPPRVGGRFDARNYLAVNRDVAASVAHSAAMAEAHWRAHGRLEHRVSPGTNLFADRTLDFDDVLAWKSGVNFFGPVGLASGLGSATRGYVAALRAAEIPVDVYDTSGIVNERLTHWLFCEADLRYSINFLCHNADQVETFVTRYGTKLFDHRANVAAWVWELPAPRPEWRSILSAFDLILTPSGFCTESFALFTDCPVRTVPHVVDAEAMRQAAATPSANAWLTSIEACKRDGRRIVLFIMDASSYRDRKGIDVFCALAERLDKREPGRFCFVVKSHAKDLSRSHVETFGGSILAMDGTLSLADLCRLKSLADLYVSPHRSEGFGLNIIESILLGVPVLCSDFAGATELLAGNEPPMIPVKLREVGRDMGPYRAEAIWAEPDLEQMEQGLLDFMARDGHHSGFRDLQRRLEQKMTASAVGAELRALLSTWCAFGAESAPDRLAPFRSLVARRHDECFKLEYVTDANRSTPDAPGIERLGEIAMGAVAPFFSVITPTYNTEPGWLGDLYDDLLNQSYPAWEWCIADDGSTRPDTLAALRELRNRDVRIKVRFCASNAGIAAATNAAVTIATARHLVMVDHDDRLSPHLLGTYCALLRQTVADGILYCDEDKLDPLGRHCETYYKPDWSPEHVLSCMYVLHCLCIRKSVFLDLGGYRSEFDGAQDHDFILRAAAANVPILHVDTLLYHWRISPASAAANATAKHSAIEIGRRVVADHLRRLGIEGTVEHGLVAGTFRVRPRLPVGTVELNILTGCTPRADDSEDTYVGRFVRSILEHPPTVPFKIRVHVDRPVAERALPMAAWDPRIEVVLFDKSARFFNFSEKSNAAIASGVADRLVLLNDDMEAMDDEWLTALLEMLELPGVGVVGGQLLYGDDTVQHCGIALGVHGGAAHLFEGTAAADVCYNAFKKVIRNYSAVTGALLAMRRSTFDRVGGFDIAYPIDYNDVDFCLRVAEAGLRTVYTPFARLRHFESRSALRLAANDLDRARFCGKWARHIERDPYYNRNLTRHGVMCE